METACFSSDPTEQPLEIAVTAAGQGHITLRALLRQAIPMLKAPHNYRQEERLQLALAFATALDMDDDLDERDPFGDSENELPTDDYEPGSELEWFEE
ncbi:MAG: hypothetical protein JWN14_1003 [Chthonomonadales bacterium]|nr:hypothetical protein [Chthonomonadales bacterium]